LPNRFKEYEVELYKSNRIKTKSKILERFLNNLTEMIKLYEETNIEPERINSNIPNSSSLPSSDKEIEIQINPYQDRQQYTISTGNQEQ
jgi:hypothetical protein